MKSYLDLDVYQSAFDLAIKVHRMTIDLPRTEQYELGSQIRRSAQSIRANIAEGYGRRKYKQDFIRFLIFAEASLLETESHLQMINKLYTTETSTRLIDEYSQLGKQLNSFISYVNKSWSTDNRQPTTDN